MPAALRARSGLVRSPWWIGGGQDRCGPRSWSLRSVFGPEAQLAATTRHPTAVADVSPKAVAKRRSRVRLDAAGAGVVPLRPRRPPQECAVFSCHRQSRGGSRRQPRAGRPRARRVGRGDDGAVTAEERSPDRDGRRGSRPNHPSGVGGARTGRSAHRRLRSDSSPCAPAPPR